MNSLISVGRQSGSAVFAPGSDLKHKRRRGVKPSANLTAHMKNRQISTKASALSCLQVQKNKGLELMIKKRTA